MQEDRFPIAAKKPTNRQRRGRRQGSLCRCCLALLVILCHLLLAGCAGHAEVAEQPTKAPPTGHAPMAGSSVDTPVAQETPTEPFWPLAPTEVTTEVRGSSSGPVITFEKTVHDFGQVSPGSKNVCEFRFKNTGTDALSLDRKIISTCGCAAPLLTKTEYAPGEEGVVHVTYTTSRVPMKDRKILTVQGNDPQKPQVKLTIVAEIVSRVAYEPKQLDLLLKDNFATCPPITLRSLDGIPFSVTGMLCTGNSITTELDPSVRATEFTIRPTVDVEKLQRLPAGYLALTLTHPECKQVTIRYNARSGFQFVPALPMFFNAEPNMPVQKVVHLSNDYGEDFEIASFSSERNLVEVLEKTKVSSDGGKGVRYRLTVSITPPIRTGQEKIFTDTLSVHLTNGQTLKLACRGIYATTQAATPYLLP